MTSLKDKAQHAKTLLPDLGSILLLRGGIGAERAVSLESGLAVLTSLQQSGAAVTDYIVNDWPETLAFIASERPQKIVIMLHGGYGEDGRLQAYLDMTDIAYTGSRSLACAKSMDKLCSSALWASNHLPVPSNALLNADKPQWPCVIKPACSGSSHGLHIVHNQKEWDQAVEQTLEIDSMMVESLIEGYEVTVCIVDNQALPSIEIIPAHGVYDYHAKYVANDTQFFCPPRCLNKAQHARLQEQALDAFHALGARSWGRIDFMLDHNLSPKLIELNTVPGMTNHSLLPMAAKAIGLTFDELVALIVLG